VNFSSRASFYFRGSGGEGVSEQWVVGVTLGSDAVEGPRVAAKAGVLGFSRSLARVVGKDGITVNLVAPGLTMIPAVAKDMPPEMVQAQVKARAIQREETGEDLIPDSDLGCAVLAHLVYLFRSLDETSNSRTTFRQLWKN
jgi:NAD(P)-dependent dehydrogenase (short-subunit alcohol dehydrogenase family)